MSHPLRKAFINIIEVNLSRKKAQARMILNYREASFSTIQKKASEELSLWQSHSVAGQLDHRRYKPVNANRLIEMSQVSFNAPFILTRAHFQSLAIRSIAFPIMKPPSGNIARIKRRIVFKTRRKDPFVFNRKSK